MVIAHPGRSPVASLRGLSRAPSAAHHARAAQLPDHPLLPFAGVAGTADAGRQPTRPLPGLAWQRYQAWVTQPVL